MGTAWLNMRVCQRRRHVIILILSTPRHVTISTTEWLRPYLILISGYWCMIWRYQKLIGCQRQLKTHNKTIGCVMQSLIKSLNFIHSFSFACNPVLLNWENLVTFHGDERQAVGNIFVCCWQSQLIINDVICCQGHPSTDSTLKTKISVGKVIGDTFMFLLQEGEVLSCKP